MFRIVQPFGPDKALQTTVISEHATAADAFRELTASRQRWCAQGRRQTPVELIVIDQDDRIVQRPGAH